MCFMDFHFLKFEHHAKTYNLIPNMISDWKMSPIFLVWHVANCSANVWVSRKIEKENDKAVNHYWEQEKVTNKIL